MQGYKASVLWPKRSDSCCFVKSMKNIFWHWGEIREKEMYRKGQDTQFWDSGAFSHQLQRCPLNKDRTKRRSFRTVSPYAWWLFNLKIFRVCLDSAINSISYLKSDQVICIYGSWKIMPELPQNPSLWWDVCYFLCSVLEQSKKNVLFLPPIWILHFRREGKKIKSSGTSKSFQRRLWQI